MIIRTTLTGEEVIDIKASLLALEGEIGMDGTENRGRIEVLEAEVLELKKIVATLLGVN